MTGVGNLGRLAFAAVRRAPHVPVFCTADSITAVPELGRNSHIGAVLQQPAHFPVLDLVARLGAKLEVIAFVVDRPGAVGLHIDAVLRVSNQVVKIPSPWFDADIGHPHQGDAVPIRGPHAAVRFPAKLGCSFTTHQVAHKLALFNKRRGLGRDSFIIPAVRTQTQGSNAVLGQVDDLRTILEVVQFLSG